MSYYKAGQNNVICDRTGFEFKSGKLKKTWDGLWVRKESWEPRHPQEFLKGIADKQTVAVSRPEAPDDFSLGASLPIPPFTYG